MNVTRCLSAVTDAEATVDALTLNPETIPKDVHVFRLAQSTTVIIVSDAVLNELSGKKMSGLAFLETRCA
jgi:hypothetical protein